MTTFIGDDAEPETVPSGPRRSRLHRTRRWGQHLRRVALVLIIVTFISFVLIDLLPGDAAVLVAGENATAEQVELVREELGLDRPLPARYVEWLGNAVRGDLGRSFQTGQPVSEALRQRVPVSLQLMVFAQVVALVIAIPLAVYSAYKPGRLVDRTTMTLGFGAAAMPNFIVGMLLILIFSGGLFSVLPVTGYVPFLEDPATNLRTIILPVLALAVGEAAVYRQLLRSDMISTLQEDFILMAKSKGLSNRQILFRHALRNSSFSLLTLAGVNMGRLIGGAVIIETLFAIPGLGQMLVQAVQNRDYMLLQGGLLFISVAYVMVNVLVDLAYSALDPRVRKHV